MEWASLPTLHVGCDWAVLGEPVSTGRALSVAKRVLSLLFRCRREDEVWEDGGNIIVIENRGSLMGGGKIGDILEQQYRAVHGNERYGKRPNDIMLARLLDVTPHYYNK